MDSETTTKREKILGVMGSWLGDGSKLLEHIDTGGVTVTALTPDRKIVATSVGASLKEAIDRMGHSIARAWVKSVRTEEPKRFGSDGDP